MKILFVNNYFYLRGGSERVFFDEASLLKSHGHEILYFATHSKNNQQTPFSKYFVSELEYKLKNIPRFIYCLESQKKIKQIIQDNRPSIAHLHNIYQDISPSVLPVLKNNGIPSVVTLHDCKLICPNYTMMRKGIICEDCYGGKFYRCIRNKCKQDSYVFSMVIALEAYVHKSLNIWQGCVNMFISPSQFLKDKLVAFGWNPSQIEVISNCVPLKKYTSQIEPGDYFLYLGRLSEEKGLHTLLKAFRGLPTHAKLFIVGSGPLERELKQVSNGDGRIIFTGHLGGVALARIIREARSLVVPSECYENAPMSIIEAMAYGKPVIGARIGGIPEMVMNGKTGFTFESGKVDDLHEILKNVLYMSDTGVKELGQGARNHVEENHTAEVHYERITGLYRKIINTSY